MPITDIALYTDYRNNSRLDIEHSNRNEIEHHLPAIKQAITDIVNGKPQPLPTYVMGTRYHYNTATRTGLYQFEVAGDDKPSTVRDRLFKLLAESIQDPSVSVAREQRQEQSTVGLVKDSQAQIKREMLGDQYQEPINLVLKHNGLQGWALQAVTTHIINYANKLIEDVTSKVSDESGHYYSDLAIAKALAYTGHSAAGGLTEELVTGIFGARSEEKSKSFTPLEYDQVRVAALSDSQVDRGRALLAKLVDTHTQNLQESLVRLNRSSDKLNSRTHELTARHT